MNSAPRHNAPTALIALICAVALLWGLASCALGASPLPASDYTVQAVCGTPTARQAACLALQLVPLTAAARAHSHPLAAVAPASQPAGAASEGEFGLTPSDLHTAYQLPLTASGTPTIALVDAYNDPTAEADLKRYDQELALPECTTGNGCFEQVNQQGNTGSLPFPTSTAELEGAGKSKQAQEAIGWGAEISLDIETAHAVCQNCKILLVEANSPELKDLEEAEGTAESLKADEISNSWGIPELGVTATEEKNGPFDHPETVITAAAGDDGYLEWAAEAPSRVASFPASSPHVVAVGGTRLLLSKFATWKTESVWNDGGESGGVKEGFGVGGGGCSAVFSAEPWQSDVSSWPEVGCGTMRAVSDVAADADPYTGVPVYYERCSSEYEKQIVHWCTYGGTSLASPIIAAAYALAGGAQGVSYPAKTLYEKATAHPYALHDVISGSNGACLKPFNEELGVTGCTNAQEGANCSSKSICVAGIGYDGPSGVGTPHGLAAFEPTSAPETPQEETALKAEREAQEAIKKAEEEHHDEQVKRQEEAEREQEKPSKEAE
ncbi:MAG TPA: S8 family serine peptidase, partial [Solirubrobacteraceae bacterium]|nr:S8 family serine peptidase [Solirubrobacteraceae bacterium]